MNVHIYYPDVSSSRTPASSSKPAIIIRRHAPAKPHPRARLPEDIAESAGPSTSPHAQSQEDNRSVSELPEESTDELARIRHLLRPPPIPGVQDWGIPPEPTEPCDEGIKVCCLALPPLSLFPTSSPLSSCVRQRNMPSPTEDEDCDLPHPQTRSAKPTSFQ